MTFLVANSTPQLPGGLITHLVKVEFVLISFSLLKIELDSVRNFCFSNNFFKLTSQLPEL